MSQGGEKTEKASGKKRSDARKRGNVLKSTEANTAICSLAMLAFMIVMFPTGIQKLMELMQAYLSADYLSGTLQLTTTNMGMLLTKVLGSVTLLILPAFGCALIVGVAANIMQVGFLFTTDAVKPKLSKINPLQGFKRMFSMRSVVELLKSLLKIALLGYILYSDYKELYGSFPYYMGKDVYLSFIDIMDTALRIAIKMALVLGIIAVFDYLYQWWRYEKDLMMTKQEVKDEYKMTEGDPVIKGRIRQKQRQISQMRMMQAVPSADVVITNPTHYAVALKYNEGERAAPVVIAKGVDLVARRIKEIAAENGIQIVENKPLAQSLYALCEVDSEIPPEFYQAVADILVYVYRQKGVNR